MQAKSCIWYVSKGQIVLPEEKIESKKFAPCEKTQQVSQGWVPPLPGSSFVIEQSNCQLIMFKQQKRLLPASVVSDFLQEKLEAFEEREGFKPSRKLRMQMKEELILELLPQSWVKNTIVPVVIMNRDGRLLVMCSSGVLADDITAYLRETLGSLAVSLPRTERDPAHEMTHWLSDETPPDFEMINQLAFEDEEGGKFSSSDIEVKSDLVRQALDDGFLVQSAKVSWREMVTFKLDSDLVMKSIKSIGDDDSLPGEDQESRFYHEFGVFLAWISQFLNDLTTSMGGLDKALAASMAKNETV